jgi:hypothetical protein
MGMIAAAVKAVAGMPPANRFELIALLRARRYSDRDARLLVDQRR